jgi:hypothetical protein
VDGDAVKTLSLTPVPAAGDLAWRGIYPTPPAVRFEVGPFCPIDDTHLHLAAAGSDPMWSCPTCGAGWDVWGCRGRWLEASTGLVVDGHLVERAERGADVEALRRLDRRLAAAIGAAAVCGFGYRVGRLMSPYAGQVPDGLLLLLAGLLAATGGVVVVAVMLLRWLDARRCASAEPVDPAGTPGGVR